MSDRIWQKLHKAMPKLKLYLTVAASLLFTMYANGEGPQTIAGVISHRSQIVLPLTVKSGFAFVKGEVNGREGVFMIDTGTPYVVFLNSSLLHLSGGNVLASGSASSGQKIVVSRYGCLTSLRIASAYTLETLCDLPAPTWILCLGN